MSALGHAFWSHVDQRGPDDCWLWTGYAIGRDDAHMYGQWWTLGSKEARRKISAHVAAYIDAYGPVPTGKMVDHKCRVTLCVNSAHLRAITNKQNLEHRTGLNRNNNSGFRGVRWDSVNSRWSAIVKSNRQTVWLGRFDDIHHAAEAARIGRRILFTHSDADAEPVAQFPPDEWWRIAHRVLVRAEPFLDGDMALRAVRVAAELPLPTNARGGAAA